MHRTAQSQRVVDAPAQRQLRVNAAGFVVFLIVHGHLGIETVAEIDRELGEHPMHRLIHVVRVVGIDESKASEIARQAIGIAQYRTRVDAEVGVTVRGPLCAEAAELVAGGISEEIVDPAATESKIGDQHFGLAGDFRHTVEPLRQFRRVGLRGIVFRVRSVVVRCSG